MAKIYEYILPNPEITSGYGMRKHPITEKWSNHPGLDLVSGVDNFDRKLKVVEDGYVHIVHYGNTGYGNYVWIRYPRLNISLLYAHLASISVKKGQLVKAGDIVGIEGKSGNATGVHLHLGMTKIGSNVWLDPSAYNYVKASDKFNLTRLLKVGTKGEDVKLMQKIVGTKADGVFGKNTLAKVKTWQRNHKLVVDGSVGYNTAHSFGWLYKGK